MGKSLREALLPGHMSSRHLNFGVVLKNVQRSVQVARAEMTDEQCGQPSQIVDPCRVTSAVSSSANTQPGAPQPEVRTSSGRVVRKPSRF